MSTFKRTTKHPVTGKYELATWIDDYFGNHNYGIEFPSDKKVYDPRAVEVVVGDYMQDRWEVLKLEVGEALDYHALNHTYKTWSSKDKATQMILKVVREFVKEDGYE